MKLSYSNFREKRYNTSYPYVADVNSVEDLKKVATYDHVCAVYNDGYNKNKVFIKGYRHTDTFKYADCLPFDCDNTNTDPLAEDIPPNEWKTPDDVRAAFPNVKFYAVRSRNDMKERNGKPPRPKFHIYFEMSRVVTNAKKYKEFKKKVKEKFPAFDKGALDSARFFYGVENPKVEYYDGSMCIDEFISYKSSQILEGSRNNTMLDAAEGFLTRFGDVDGKAYQLFVEKAKHCDPPLDDEELNTIWNNALNYYNDSIKTNTNYISPEEYNSLEFSESLIPSDFSDLGQATAFLDEYGEKVIYVTGLGFHFYTGKVWKNEELLVQKAIQDFTYKQLALAWKMMNEAEEDDEKAQSFYKFVIQRRKSSNLKAVMNEIKPMVQTDIKNLDKDGYLLNTPERTVNLRTGEMQKHNPKDYCTKITAVSPSDVGYDEWQAFLKKFTQNDKELEAYLQTESGMECIGEMLSENLAIENGNGGNGKSTFNNAKFYALGNYAGTVAADLLTVNPSKSKGAELAELRGKRFIIAAELQEGTRLDTGALKNLCSTDPIHAEKKYEAPFEFVPTHTVVLYTNHLPKVGTIDSGTWDRIVVIPLKAKFRGNGDEIKNYGKVLFERCGGAIVKWMIEGAKMYIDNGCRLNQPKCIKDAIAEYREDNDWLSHFLNECCETDKSSTQRAGELYEAYRAYCEKMGEYKRSSSDFKKALVEKGYCYNKTRTGFIWFGLVLKEDYKSLF